jgi:hypothetical protein
MKLFKSAIISLLLVLPITAHATVDFLSVNEITKEYYWGDEDRSTGWIGWTIVPETKLETAESELLKRGYTESEYPYKIEFGIALVLLMVVCGQYFVRRRMKKNRL